MTTTNIRPTRRVPIVTPGWDDFFEETGVPAAVRDGNTVYVTGHTGEDDDLTFSPDPAHQIRRTFESIASALAAAGADWSDVMQMTSYHVGLRSQVDALISVSREFLASPTPAWAAVGVTELWDEGSVVEISCIAVIAPTGDPAAR